MISTIVLDLILRPPPKPSLIKMYIIKIQIIQESGEEEKLAMLSSSSSALLKVDMG